MFVKGAALEELNPNTEANMITVEMRFMANGREVSLEEVAATVAEQVVRRIGREMRQQAEALPRTLPINSSDKDLEPRAVSVLEAARLLSVSEAALRKFIGQKRLHAVYIGGRVLIPMDAIKQALQHGIPRQRSQSS